MNSGSGHWSSVGGGGATYPVATGRPLGVPQKKSITYDKLTITYRYDDKMLFVEDESSGQEFSFTEAELAEFKNALTHFGLGTIVPPGDGVTCR